MKCSTLVCLALATLTVLSSASAATPDAGGGGFDGKRIHFKKTRLDDQFRSEGVAVGDFNHDGKNDIAAGSVYYAAPDWIMVEMEKDAKIYQGEHGYSESFCNWAEDVNGDGWTDLIVVDFPAKQTRWLENPKEPGRAWKRHQITPVTNNESPQYLDIDGDGKRDLLCGFADDKGRGIGYVTRTDNVANEWTKHSIGGLNPPGSMMFSHGIGAGDVNKDGRTDILTLEGWWEAPEDRSATPWNFHRVNEGDPKSVFGALCSQMYVYDFDNDGDSDVINSSAHQIGVWWHEQTPAGWKTHEIDTSFSQTHAANLVDMNGDGLPDFVTGKRFWAHGPKGDLQPDAPAVIYWYELSRKDGKVEWIRHEIDNDSGVGTQFEVADVNGDGLLDVAVANKKGAFYLEQVRD